MDFQLFSGTRWEILESVAKEPKGTKALAQTLLTSQANVSQHVRQLELANLIKKRRSKNVNSYFEHSITRTYGYLIYLRKGVAQKKEIYNDPIRELCLAIAANDRCLELFNLYTQHGKILQKLKAIGVLNRKQLELFVLAENVDEIRQKHSTLELELEGQKKKVVVWSHTYDEVKSGLDRKENYFIKNARDVEILYDPENLLLELQEMQT